MVASAASYDHLTIDADRVAPKLWIGSAPPTGDVLMRSGFSAVVLAAEEYQPSSLAIPGVKVIHAPFSDTLSPTIAEVRVASRAAAMVAELVSRGERVLVSCWMGKNRSGLVTALALRKLYRVSPGQAVSMVRSARPGALFNPSFAELVAVG